LATYNIERRHILEKALESGFPNDIQMFFQHDIINKQKHNSFTINKCFATKRDTPKTTFIVVVSWWWWPLIVFRVCMKPHDGGCSHIFDE
jgi:hypothetical protein